MNNNDLEIALNERFLLQEEYLGTDKEVNHAKPLVSITVATYQHVNYITECLEGILVQQVDFSIEIIIGEDGSTDGTQDVCRKYAENHPDKIRLFIRDRQLSQYLDSKGNNNRFNGLWNRMSARGKYIAWCDGDDYWTDPLKLQKQVDFLEKHSDYGLVYTLSQVYNQSKGQMKEKSIGLEYKDYDDLLAHNCIPAVTACIRSDVITDYTNDVKPQQRNWLMGDYPMWLWVAYHYKIKFLPEVTSVYRVLDKSLSHFKDIQTNEKFILSTIDISKFYINKFKLSPSSVYQYSLNEYYYELYDKYIHVGNYKKSKQYAKLIDFKHASSRIRKKVRLFYFRYLKYSLLNLFSTNK